MENWDEMVRIIKKYDLDGEDVLRLLTDWHGTDLLADDFMENLHDCEGYE